MKNVDDKLKATLEKDVLTSGDAARLASAMRSTLSPVFPYRREMIAPLKFINARPGDSLERGEDRFVVLDSKLKATNKEGWRLTMTFGSSTDSLFDVEDLSDYKLVAN